MSLLWIVLACGELESPTTQDVNTTEDVELKGIEREIDQGNVLVRMTVTPETLKLGDPFTLELDVLAQNSLTVEMPPFGEALGRLSIVGYQPRESVVQNDRFTGMQYRQTYTLQANRSGEMVVPSLRIAYQEGTEEWQEILTDEVPLTVMGILPEDADLVLQEARGQMSPILKPVDWWPWALGTAGALIGLGSLVWMRQTTRSFKTQSPFERVDEGLERLKKMLNEEMDCTQWYTELSQVLRRLLEDQYQVSALEQTTQELKRSLPVFAEQYPLEITESNQASLFTLLVQCDGVKFAGRTMTLEQAHSDWQRASDWVEELRVSVTKLSDNSVEREVKDA
jgi:hypothetical protein